MPLLTILKPAPDVMVGVWKMDETEEQLLSFHPSLRRYGEELNTRFHQPGRRKEWLSVRALLAALFPTDTPFITYGSDGRPLTDGNRSISISHTKGYVAVIVARNHRVGIDIEQRGRKIAHLKKHILRDDEHADNDDDLLTIWCGKETMYKLFPDDRLTTQQVKTTADVCDGIRTWNAHNLKQDIGMELHGTLHEEFILVYAFLPD